VEIDYEYIAERNKFIPMAATHADRFVPLIVKNGKTIPDRGDSAWARIYFNEMDRLVTEAGLQSARFHRKRKSFLGGM